MSALIFLSIALIASLIGTAVLLLQHRKPNQYDSGIHEFRREMDALRPPDDDGPTRRGGR